jgi:AbrB family looped-hinge helix DNA binding protein
MKLKIDKAGRIVIPKAMRERLKWNTGTDLEMQETAEGLLLKPIGQRPSLVRSGRFLVHTGELPGGQDILKAIAHHREERLRKLAGL